MRHDRDCMMQRGTLINACSARVGGSEPASVIRLSPFEAKTQPARPSSGWSPGTTDRTAGQRRNARGDRAGLSVRQGERLARSSRLPDQRRIVHPAWHRSARHRDGHTATLAQDPTRRRPTTGHDSRGVSRRTYGREARCGIVGSHHPARSRPRAPVHPEIRLPDIAGENSA